MHWKIDSCSFVINSIRIMVKRNEKKASTKRSSSLHADCVVVQQQQQQHTHSNQFVKAIDILNKIIIYPMLLLRFLYGAQQFHMVCQRLLFIHSRICDSSWIWNFTELHTNLTKNHIHSRVDNMSDLWKCVQACMCDKLWK